MSDQHCKEKHIWWDSYDSKIHAKEDGRILNMKLS